MKAKLKLLLGLFLFFFCEAQSVAQVTIGEGVPPQKFSVLELSTTSTKGGLRLPHLTTAARDALSSTSEFQIEAQRGNTEAQIDPGLALGLTIYNTDTNCNEYWNGYKWVSLCLGTANIELKTDCTPYDPANPPVEASDGRSSECIYTPEDTPACSVTSGNAYDVYLTVGSTYATLTVDALTSAFSINFSPNNSNLERNAIVRVINNCTGEFSDFVFTQEKADCPLVDDPILNASTLVRCDNGSVYAYITNSEKEIDYIWTFGGVIVHTGTWYEIKRAGVYKVYSGLLGCGSPALLTVTDDDTSIAPVNVTISATNGGVLCNRGKVILTATTTQEVEWYLDGIPQGSDNPKILDKPEYAGEWFAAVKNGTCMSNSSNIITIIDNTMSGNALPTPEAMVNEQSLTEGDITICKNGTLKLEITNTSSYPAGVTYEWFINGGSISKGTSPIVYVTTPNVEDLILSVTVSDLSDSCPNTSMSQKSVITFTSPNATAINNGALQTAICGANPAILIADYGNASAYEWILNGEQVIGETSNTLLTNKTGNYRVRYQDSNGCWSRISTAIEVIASAPINMAWNPQPSDKVVKGESHTYSIIASPAAKQYEWSWTSTDENAIYSIIPIDNGSSATVIYGQPTEASTEVELIVKTINHFCGDAKLKTKITIEDGCSPVSSINLVPSGIIKVTEGASQLFKATGDGSNNNNDLKYQWFVDDEPQAAPSSINTFTYEASGIGAHVVSVRVTNNCTSDADDIRASTSIQVLPDVSLYEPDVSGKYKITGKNCFDVAQSNFGSVCGSEAQRPGDFLDENRNWVERSFNYVFTTSSTNYTDLEFITEDPSILIKTETTVGTTHTLIFNKDVLDKVKGKDKLNALDIVVYAVFKENGVKKRIQRNIKVQDCWCACGAYIASNTWKIFMCHNLGADDSLDAFDPTTTSAKKGGLNGDYYQWGRKNAAATSQTQSGAIVGWNKAVAKSGSWADYTRGPEDPCPTGYRVPASAELSALNSYNKSKRIGSWTSSTTNFSAGILYGDNLFLPAAGHRDCSTGALSSRGSSARYWTSSGLSNNKDSYAFKDGNIIQATRLYGYSVRCIAQ